jgi:hypothetical protein
MQKFARGARIAAGAAIWAFAAWLAAPAVIPPAEGRGKTAEDLTSYFLGRSLPVVLRFDEDVDIAVGDAVYHRGPEGVLSPVGEVRALVAGGSILPAYRAYPGDGVREIRCTIRPGIPGGVTRDARGRLIAVPQGMTWVIRTLLPPEKLKELAVQWNATLYQQRDEIFASLSPAFRRAMKEIEEALARDVPLVLAAHRDELGAIGRRLYSEIIDREFRPLVKTDLWPIIERRSRPTVEALTAELWSEVPLWSVTWRAAFQSLPLTSDRWVAEALERFWRNKAIPILQAHSDDFLLVAQDVIREAAANERVASAFRKSLDLALHDEEVQHIARLIFQGAVLDNPRFHETLKTIWASPEMTRAIEEIAPRLEPMIRRMGAEILGTPEGGITPGFARILRTQILQKDRRWVLIDCPGDSREPLEPGAVIPAVLERS